MKPSVQDVAKAAGVGASTVSRALNNHPHISAEAKARVLEAAQRLNYTPDPAARTLRSGQTHAVSVLLPLIGTAFYETLLLAIYDRLSEAGFDLALFPLLGQQRVRRYLDSDALVYRADGLILASQNPDQLYGSLPGGRAPFAKPMVLVDAQHPAYHSVSFDNRSAGAMAAGAALESGLPVVVIEGAEVEGGGLASPVFSERRRGLLDELARRGVWPLETLRLDVVRGQVVPEAAAHLIAQSVLVQSGLAHPPSGQPFFVVALSDDLALGTLPLLMQAGLRSRRDYLMLGFDGSAAAAQAGLTSVVQPAAELGRAAAELLLEAMRGELTLAVQRVFAPTLRRGDSTRPLL
ncbi:LacI family DNA-binding transcriptional regulator [Deinococcus sp.]|uniref:LacI family DNA-binding transcriptional regulator n=1 Tax=Deinococcus sp. TaxID=47478 RepID=UPI003CC50C4C